MTEGLREKKMRLTRQQLEQAAVEIAYAEGIQAVTVDRVCEAVMVSRSTFFNYFPSLEVAIFGAPLEYDPELTDRLLSEHAPDLIVAASFIVVSSVRGQSQNQTTQRRLALFAREPGTTATVSWASNTSRNRLITVIADWLDRHPEHKRVASLSNEEEARFIVTLSIALGDEAIRDLREENGELQVDAAVYRRAREKMATLLTRPSASQG